MIAYVIIINIILCEPKQMTKLILLLLLPLVPASQHIQNVIGQVAYFMEDDFTRTIHKRIVLLSPMDGSQHIVCSNVTTNAYNGMTVNWNVLMTSQNTAEFINDMTAPFNAYFGTPPRNDLAIIRINLDGQAIWFGPSHCNELCLRYTFWEYNTYDTTITGAIADSSNGALQLSYDKSIITTVSINFDGTCRPFEWIDSVMSILDLQSYKYKILVVPLDAHCSWAGLATLSCSYSGNCITFVRSMDPGVYVHELGHNFGFTHSSSDLNDDGFIDNEYGDDTCYMGNVTGWKRYNALHRWTIGWIPRQNKVRAIFTNDTVNSYVLSSSSIDFVEPVIQILTIVNPSTGIEYWLSIRTNISSPSYDAHLDSRYVDKISVHRYNSLATNNKLFIKTLSVGETMMNNTVLFYGFSNDHQVRIDLISPGYVSPLTASSSITRTPTRSTSNSISESSSLTATSSKSTSKTSSGTKSITISKSQTKTLSRTKSITISKSQTKTLSRTKSQTINKTKTINLTKTLSNTKFYTHSKSVSFTRTKTRSKTHLRSSSRTKSNTIN